VHSEIVPQFSAIFKDFDLGDLYLDRFILSDAPKVLMLRSDPTVLKYISREPMETEAQAVEWTESRISDLNNNLGINWVIRSAKGCELIGTVGYWRFDPERFRAEIGYSLLPQHHGKGIMTRCLQCVLPFAFNEMNMHSIGAEIDPLNLESQKVLEKSGFRKEAHFTEDFYFRGKFSDSAIYSLLEKWLR
jgi:ribosomal-protein-alanine N-acetyltransferase